MKHFWNLLTHETLCTISMEATLWNSSIPTSFSNQTYYLWSSDLVLLSCCLLYKGEILYVKAVLVLWHCFIQALFQFIKFPVRLDFEFVSPNHRYYKNGLWNLVYISVWVMLWDIETIFKISQFNNTARWHEGQGLPVSRQPHTDMSEQGQEVGFVISRLVVDR